MKPRRRRGGAWATLGGCLFVLSIRPSVPRAYAQHWWEPTPTPTPSPTPSGPEPTSTPEGGCGIHVLKSPPAEAFEIVGIVEVEPRVASTNPEAALAAAKIQGCVLGGDALVVLYQDVRYRGRARTALQRPGVLSDPALRAAVIRYRAR